MSHTSRRPALGLAMPDSIGGAGGSGTSPHTPLAHEFPLSFGLALPRSMPGDPRGPGLLAEPLTPDMASLALGYTLTPTPSPGSSDEKSDPTQPKKRKSEGTWYPDQIELLQDLLARPPDGYHFPPGAMPPPNVLDDIATLIVRSFAARPQAGINEGGGGPVTEEPEEAEIDEPYDEDEDEDGGDDGSERGSDTDMDDTEDDSADLTNSGSRLAPPNAPVIPTVTPPTPPGSTGDKDSHAEEPVSPHTGIDNWPHSWAETRSMLTTLALADTRLGHERDDRKLTRQEKLARPGVKRVGSMDYLDEVESDMASERIGRVLRLSTTLQNSAKESVALVRAASQGASGHRTPMSSFAMTPTSSQGSALGLGIPRSSPMRRRNSTRSTGSATSSRRPSLLARGRSFTADDLEAEEAAAAAQAASDTSSLVEELDSPQTPPEDLPRVRASSPSHSPAKRRASPRALGPRLHRSLSDNPHKTRTPAGSATGGSSAGSSVSDPLPCPPRSRTLDAAFDSLPVPFSSDSSDSDGAPITMSTSVGRAAAPKGKGRIKALAMTAMPSKAKCGLRSPFEEKAQLMPE